jgi:acetolactate synthase-1/2/3 large subunit
MVGAGMAGIKLVHVRHEQAGPYAADGYARASGKVGICFGTSGPGVTNMISGIAHAHKSKSPIVCFLGHHATINDGRDHLQECNPDRILPSITKWTRTILNTQTIAYFVKKAIRDAMTWPQGAVCLVTPADIMSRRTTLEQQVGYVPNAYEQPLPPQGNPLAVAKAAEALIHAQRPVIAGGQDIFWSHAEDELKEFVERCNIPVITRRQARGAVPEIHPLAFRGGARSKILRASDVACIIGLRLDFLEGYGAWALGKKLIQITQSMGDVETTAPTEQIVLGSPKMVLQQMIDYIKQNYKNGVPRKEAWLAQVNAFKEAEEKELADELARVKNNVPLHPAWVADQSLSVLEDDATVILDGHTSSTHTTPRFIAKKSARLLDSGLWAGVGHGIAMGIGAQLARPGKQVLVIMGDGGMGLGGWDFETAVRCQLPIVYQINNNRVWHAIAGPKFVHSVKLVGEQTDVNHPCFMHETDYAKFAECCGGIGIRVEDPKDIAKAHAEAFELAHAQNRPAIVDLIVDPSVGGPNETEEYANYELLRKRMAWLDPEDLDEHYRALFFPDLVKK